MSPFPIWDFPPPNTSPRESSIEQTLAQWNEFVRDWKRLSTENARLRKALELIASKSVGLAGAWKMAAEVLQESEER